MGALAVIANLDQFKDRPTFTGAFLQRGASDSFHCAVSDREVHDTAMVSAHNYNANAINAAIQLPLPLMHLH